MLTKIPPPKLFAGKSHCLKRNGVQSLLTGHHITVTKTGFFKELNKSLSNIERKYENVLVVGDVDIDKI